MTQAHPIPTDRRFIDHTGQRFGRLAVLSYAGRAAGGTLWNCVCDCGKVTVSAGNKLRTGLTKSCGCKNREERGDWSVTHGMSKHPVYAVWKAMRARCYRKTDTSYRYYGARGITVCDRWRNSFVAFLDDMGPRPTGRFAIERRDNSRGYEPGNCYWATITQQARNKRNNRLVQANGKTQCLSAWAEELGLKHGAIHARIASGMDPAEAVTTPPAWVLYDNQLV